MGGTIAWIIRQADGTILPMLRWTNIFPTVLLAPGFLEGDAAAMDDALAQWHAMRDDWQANGPKGPFDLPMTPVYAPYPAPLAPEGYGLIVVDFVTRSVLNAQGYTDLSRANSHMISAGKDTAHSIGFGERYDGIARLYADGRITGVMGVRDGHITSVPIPPGLDVEEAAAFANDEAKRSDIFPMFDINPPEGWTFTTFEETRAGWAAFRDALLAKGFPLTPGDLAKWKPFLSGRR